MAELAKLVAYIDDLLDVREFSDYAPNGLQVEGRQDVDRLVSGVTASKALIEAAIDCGADALLVHHGYFWRHEDPCLTGMKRRRLQCLLANDISLLAYHLPLDAHPLYGNNIQLAKRLGIEMREVFGPASGPALVCSGALSEAMSVQVLLEHVEQCLGRRPVHISGGREKLQTIAWCTGAAQDYFELAARQGVDVFLTGEISEPSTHIAREYGVHFIAAGHHATERYGVQALAEHVAETFSIHHQFIDIDNPA